MNRGCLGQEPRQYTTKEKLANWFYYNKWWLLVAAIILYVIGNMVWNALGIGQIKPDYCVAYVGNSPLPADCVSALEKELAALGEDLNGDGTVTVKLHLYVNSSNETVDDLTYSYAAEVTLLADITEGTSYLFLVEDPAEFQLNYQILAEADGSAPEEDDFVASDKVLRWADCPALAGLELGGYEEKVLDQVLTGDCQELLSGLYIGRRYYYNESEAVNLEGNEKFWQVLTEGAHHEEN